MTTVFDLAGAAIRKARDRVASVRDPVGFARRLGVVVGERCRFLAVERATFGSEPWLVTIGDHVTVTEGVRFITHDGGRWVIEDEYPQVDVIAPIVVGNDVFIGLRSILLPGVVIGDRSVVAAGAVVASPVESGTVVAGVPARPLMSIDEYREKLLAKSLPIRHLAPDEKKRALLERFHPDRTGR
jgi:acetyltransferase-like isoleucine patch superfamily enzyme